VRSDVYFAADIEADGPLPGPYSMLSFGLVLVGRYDGEHFEPDEQSSHTFYRELQPVSEHFDPASLKVAGLDRDALKREAAPPVVAMQDARDWVLQTAGDGRPVMVAWPLAYDWLFLQWYFLRYCEDGSPFGFSSAVDMKTLYWWESGALMDASGLHDLPGDLRPRAPHTHNALDDAVEAAELFRRLWARRSS
jgi:hypothetical protein